MRSSCLAEWGSTTGRRCWPGAEGGQLRDSGVLREFAVRVSEPVTTPRHATPRHATQDSICCPHNFFRTLRCAYRGGVRQRRRRCPFRPSARRDDRVFAREQAAPQPRPIPLLTVSLPALKDEVTAQVYGTLAGCRFADLFQHFCRGDGAESCLASSFVYQCFVLAQYGTGIC